MGLEMKCLNILHIGILSHYTEGMTYQDNMLSEINVILCFLMACDLSVLSMTGF